MKEKQRKKIYKDMFNSKKFIKFNKKISNKKINKYMDDLIKKINLYIDFIYGYNKGIK